MGNRNEREVSRGLGWGRGDWGLVLKVNLGRVKGKATEGKKEGGPKFGVHIYQDK